MKHSSLILFVSIVTLIYTLGNYYLFSKGFKLLPNIPVYKYVYSILFILLASLFLINRVLLFNPSAPQPSFVFQVGGIWLAGMLYFMLLALLGNVLGIADRFLHFLPDLQPYKFKILLSSIGIVALILGIGYINARTPEVKKMQVHVAKHSNLSSLRIVQVSDVHFGNVIGPDELKKMVHLIEEQKPDLLLITGDFIDEGVTASMVNEVKPYFEQLQPKFGKIAILGNHEYINQLTHTMPIFGELGITLLRDSVLTFDKQFVVAGRDDYSSRGMFGVERKTIPALLEGVDKTLPLILLDHQPYALDVPAKNGVDLQLSGHTHHGQMFPMHLITKAMYEVSWGYKQKENTHYYVSSGYGTWGPRIRLGNRPEVVVIDMSFE